MKFKIAKSDLLDGLQKVQGVVGTRSTLPILSNVLFEAEGDTLTLTTTDLEVSVRCSVKIESGKDGVSSFPAKRLFSIIRELPNADIEFDVDDNENATITCESAFFKIIGLPGEDFPQLPDFKGATSYSIDQHRLKDMLKKTSYAVSSDETRYVLNGVLLSFKGDKLTMVATDGRRLALIESELEFPDEAESDLIVPTKAVNELLHILGDEGSLKLLVRENQIAFSFDDILLVSKLIEGTYPNYRQVIPSQCEERATIEAEGFHTAIKRVALLTTDKSHSVKLIFEKNTLTVQASTPDVGEAKESIPIKYGGKKITVAFNPEYVIHPLRHLESDEVFMELTDDLSPGVLKCEQPFLYVLMPMRVS